jgi:hypothetical protein
MARAATGPSRPPVEAIPARDRRTGTRQPLEVLGIVTELHGADNHLQVAVVNVSLHGCAFTSPVPFRPGAAYTMRIGTGLLHLSSTIRIISSRDRSDGRFDVGAKFV